MNKRDKQDLGFTRRDVEMTREHAAWLRVYGGDDDRRWDDLADLIEARLPPENDTLAPLVRTIPCTLENGDTVIIVGPEITITEEE